MKKARVTCTFPAIVVAVFVACGSPRQHGPMDYVQDCRPGASVYRCYAVLKLADRKPVFPAGWLESVQVAISNVVKGHRGIAAIVDKDHVFTHSMHFENGRAEVIELLRAALGEPQTGKPPIQAVELEGLAGVFWQTDEGYWFCEDEHPGWKEVYWMSKPFPILDKDKGLGLEQREVDRYVHQASQAATLWAQIGRRLVGANTGP